MIDWFKSMDTLQAIFAAIAIPATLVLIIQTILSMFAMGGDDGGGVDADGGEFADLDGDGISDYDEGHIDAVDDGLRIFSVRGAIAFFCVFGWAGLLYLRNDIHVAVSIPLAFVLGAAFMVLMAYLFALFMKLQANGAADIRSAVGVNGTVYLTVPASRLGAGKVSAMVSGRYAEYNAVTDDEQPIPTQQAVTVVGVTGENTLVVMRK